MSNSEVCVPAKAVQIDDNKPEVGDEIDVTLKGKVTRVDGDSIYFKATEANGQPIEAKANEGDEQPEEPTEESLRARAEEEDQASITA